MLTEIKTPTGSHFTFTFLSGEQYSLGFGFCDNPACRCGTMYVSLLTDREDLESRPSFEFSVDLLSNALDADNKKRPAAEQEIGEAFVRELSEENWQLLNQIFYSHKRKVTEETPDDKIDAHFPMDEIEKNSTMVRFHEILPYAEYLTLNIEDRQFYLDESYCVRVNCHCTDVVVNLLDSSNAEGNSPAIFLNYQKKDWKIEEACGADPEFLKRAAQKLLAEDYLVSFQGHHNRLQALYRGYLKRNHPKTSSPAQHAVGRNDPCPCGSGKKYKKCCLISSTVSWKP